MLARVRSNATFLSATARWAAWAGVSVACCVGAGGGVVAELFRLVGGPFGQRGPLGGVLQARRLGRHVGVEADGGLVQAAGLLGQEVRLDCGGGVPLLEVTQAVVEIGQVLPGPGGGVGGGVAAGRRQRGGLFGRVVAHHVGPASPQSDL